MSTHDVLLHNITTKQLASRGSVFYMHFILDCYYEVVVMHACKFWICTSAMLVNHTQNSFLLVLSWTSANLREQHCLVHVSLEIACKSRIWRNSSICGVTWQVTLLLNILKFNFLGEDVRVHCPHICLRYQRRKTSGILLLYIFQLILGFFCFVNIALTFLIAS